MKRVGEKNVASLSREVMHANEKSSVTLFGHPFSTLGMGEQMRSHVRSASSVGLEVSALDIYRYAARTDRSHLELMHGIEVAHADGGVRIFHINGDEIDPVLSHLARGNQLASAGYNIIVPAWELPKYPKVWAEKLKKFDEVWALSRYIGSALHAAGVKCEHVGQSVQIPRRFFLSRRFFGIREDAFCLLAFYDKTSYFQRKNPNAVLELFAKLRKRNPYLNIQLVLKAKEGDSDASSFVEDFKIDAKDIRVITKALSQFETHSLINSCDCFVSLHRAEGFGRGTGEAMSLGRLALATGWSGNMDYMDAQNSLIADYTLTLLKEGDYPHWEGQSWAEADVDHALRLVEHAIEDATHRERLCRRATLTILQTCGDRAVGLRMLHRLTRH